MAAETNSRDNGVLRLIDANLNRLKEGIRVLEDFCRFVYDFPQEAKQLKELRHTCRTSFLFQALGNRDIEGDPLKQTTRTEQKREDERSVVTANFKRAQESARTLEESLKLFNADEAECFKKIRYALYAIEKNVFSKLPTK